MCLLDTTFGKEERKQEGRKKIRNKVCKTKRKMFFLYSFLVYKKERKLVYFKIIILKIDI